MKMFRSDGQPSRDDECEHGFRHFEKCAHCLEIEIERLREALRMIADGDVPRQHVIRWRQDGQLSKHDKCPHDKWMYDDCDECVASFARAALGEKE